MSSGNSTRILQFPDRGASSALRAHARAAIAGAGDVHLARLRVRAPGRANYHDLGTWQPDPDRPGLEAIACMRCGAGGRVDLSTAEESLAPALLEVCRS